MTYAGAIIPSARSGSGLQHSEGRRLGMKMKTPLLRRSLGAQAPGSRTGPLLPGPCGDALASVF